jgi:hypothetical protein
VVFYDCREKSKIYLKICYNVGFDNFRIYDNCELMSDARVENELLLVKINLRPTLINKEGE